LPPSSRRAIAAALLAIATSAAAAPMSFVPQYLPARAHRIFAAPETGAVPNPGRTSRSVTRHAEHKPPAHDPKATRILDIAGLGEVTLYAPRGEAHGLALFASGDGGWNLGVWDMAQQAASLGYWVAGFSTPALLKSLERGTGTCSDAATALADLGAQVRAALDISAHYHPILIGYSSGATVVYAALAQAGDARFSGAMTLGFCPDLVYHKPFCEDAGLTADKQHKPPYGYVFNTVPRVHAPWIVLQGDIDKVCNPPATRNFVDKVKNGKVINLPHVGHGYGVPRHWMPQYIQGLIELRDSETLPGSRVASSNR
jgi:type IV secretory pathway VirJ component